MNKERQRIAIAEACGWKMIITQDSENYPHGINPNGDRMHTELLPDYLHDLNAMHEAEKTLTNEQHKAFRRFLFDDIESDHDAGDNENDERYFVSATAAQRAEPFLKALGKWEDDQ